MDWYLKVLKAYAVFSGRARRKEYWMFVLISVLVAIGLALLDVILNLRLGGGKGLLSTLYSLGVLIPALAVAVRRLHDTNRSGWWLLLGLIPIVGSLVLLVFFVLDSTPGTNRFGPNPKSDDAAPGHSLTDRAA
ncbi:DUF805 domain-containing protein [Pararobbsia alpina]|uniref:Inner membrane protein YhaH n=1 Tax=Pararobbsia alpina TaxID=621374 RepID=A0A6S7BB92_9BURK|nr:DUF805 domain-containing protein [Pararobbsia alpina]CAB3794214.1 Inner membrane protein YhaH [Pararobbsia alpina]